MKKFVLGLVLFAVGTIALVGMIGILYGNLDAIDDLAMFTVFVPTLLASLFALVAGLTIAIRESRS